MTPTSSSVAKEVLSYCTSCKMDLQHMVVAMQGDRIAKVQCKTCEKTHVFRAPKGVTEPTVKKAGKRGAGKKAAAGGEGGDGPSSIQAEWEKLMAAHKATPSKSYSMKGRFLLGDRVDHPNFGEGIVGKLIYPNKIEVIFKNDVKILIHGGLA